MRLTLIALTMLIPFCLHAEDRQAGITVQGEAVTKVAPDQVSIPVTVHEENANLGFAKQRHDERLRKLLQLAQDAGIAKEKIQTNYTAVNPQYDYVNNRSVLRGYQVQTTINFTLTDISKLASFMESVVSAGIDTVGSVSYSLQDEDKVKEDTEVKALEHAYEKAGRLAAAAKVTLGRPLYINEGNVEVARPMRVMMAASAAMAPGMAPPQLPEGMLEIRQSVTVTYAIQ